MRLVHLALILYFLAPLIGCGKSNVMPDPVSGCGVKDVCTANSQGLSGYNCGQLRVEKDRPLPPSVLPSDFQEYQCLILKQDYYQLNGVPTQGPGPRIF